MTAMQGSKRCHNLPHLCRALLRMDPDREESSSCAAVLACRLVFVLMRQHPDWWIEQPGHLVCTAVTPRPQAAWPSHVLGVDIALEQSQTADMMYIERMDRHAHGAQHPN